MKEVVDDEPNDETQSISTVERMSETIRDIVQLLKGDGEPSDKINYKLKTFCHAKKVSFVDECLYIYIHGEKMGSIRDNDTDEKKLRRYIHSSEAHERAAEYMILHAPSERVKFFAENLLMPEAVIRKFTIAARMNDIEKYKSLCHDKNLRKILRRSYKIFFRKPEIFLKAFTILFLPDFYFYLRKEKK